MSLSERNVGIQTTVYIFKACYSIQISIYKIVMSMFQSIQLEISLAICYFVKSIEENENFWKLYFFYILMVFINWKML